MLDGQKSSERYRMYEVPSSLSNSFFLPHCSPRSVKDDQAVCLGISHDGWPIETQRRRAEGFPEAATHRGISWAVHLVHAIGVEARDIFRLRADLLSHFRTENSLTSFVLRRWWWREKYQVCLLTMLHWLHLTKWKLPGYFLRWWCVLFYFWMLTQIHEWRYLNFSGVHDARRKHLFG